MVTTTVGVAISAYWLLVEEASVHVKMEWNYYLEIRFAVTVIHDKYISLLKSFKCLICSPSNWYCIIYACQLYFDKLKGRGTINLQILLHLPGYIENNTWSRGDMEFIFECSHRYWTSERSERLRYRMWTREDKFHISKRPFIILFII